MQLCPALWGAEAVRAALLRFLQLSFPPPEGFCWRFPVRQNSIAGGGGQAGGGLWVAVFSFDGRPMVVMQVQGGSLSCRSGAQQA